MAGPLVLFGPQRPRPNAPDALAAFGGDGPVVVLTAGWRHDETDDEALRRQLGPDTAVLPLYTWFEVVLRELPELRAEYRARQDALLRLKRLHRVRLHPALQVVSTLTAHDGDPLAAEGLQLAIDDLRRIDAQLLEGADRVHASNLRITEPWTAFPVVERLRERARVALSAARAIVLTGGHVAVLLNRLAFFGVDRMLRELHQGGTPILAWSAGAMVLSERVVLYYDDPPDGPAYPELLDRGFGVIPGLVVLPHARQRLRLDDPARVSLLATRFAPATCLGLENGARLDLEDGRWVNRGAAGAALALGADGAVRALEPGESP